MPTIVETRGAKRRFIYNSGWNFLNTLFLEFLQSVILFAHMNRKWILTLSCQDQLGIVSNVSTFLTKHQGFITELAQFGDPSTGRFFMRSVFEFQQTPLTFEQFKELFDPVATQLHLQWELHNPAK